MHDVIIVGGGPAGAAAAIVCARAGLDTVLLERRPALTDKPGETLHPGVEPLLEHLGVAAAVRAAGFLRHAGIEVAWGGAPRFEPYGVDSTGAWRGFQAWRASFDQLLLNAVDTHGGSVRHGVRVRDVRLLHRGVAVGTDVGPMATRWIVDASGGVHCLARHLRLRRQQLSPRLLCRYGYVRRASGEPPRLRGDARGWLWVAEVKPGLYQWTRLAFGDVDARSIPIAGESVGRPRAADVTWRWFPRCAGPGYYLVGDAAAVFDPASSHGVLRALMTGIYAGHLIAGAEHGSRQAATACRAYRDWLAAWIRHDAAEMRRMYRQLSEHAAWATFGASMPVPSPAEELGINIPGSPMDS